MNDVGNILNDDDFFGDIVDTSKEGTEQYKKRECLKSVIDGGRVHLLGSKWTQEKVDKASDKIINKTYAEYKQRELNEKGEKTGRVLCKHVIKSYYNRISQLVNIRDVKKLRQDIEDDPLIKDQMTYLGCFLVYTLGDYLASVLVGFHTIKKLGSGDGHDNENEGHESEGP